MVQLLSRGAPGARGMQAPLKSVICKRRKKEPAFPKRSRARPEALSAVMTSMWLRGKAGGCCMLPGVMLFDVGFVKKKRVFRFFYDAMLLYEPYLIEREYFVSHCRF